ncbi:MAG: DUF3800 domain-containing protein [Zetaproteobacteria bacterium CG02_land_8_20_14_3_00_50_9]|nr:MAG: hypothetical protein COW62_00680 [Zetaproteobacteria bacterium CG17_big_fil_post_rev_8_21_14_2_50_50_13]PIV31124.1 MAG: DUF3800 domain-containing protein [Zetaproteobacteria bacterium CG02_land_8_20_14_3_00_50_9]
MTQEFNIYCDESCHLEHDGISPMVLGCIWSPANRRMTLDNGIRQIKVAHGLSANFEIKWTKVSDAKLDFYKAVIDYFFDEERLHFRGLVIPDKSKLDHQAFGQTHDDFYYKMYFLLLKQIFEDDNRYRIYLDIKDTQSQTKAVKLHDYLCNARYDFDREMIQRVQHVRSHEVEQLQLADLLIGALSYYQRGLTTSKSKQALIHHIKARAKLTLENSTWPSERKFNLFHWDPQGL